MKLKILFVLCFFSLMTAKTQIVSIVNETFESTLSGWTIIPSNSWKADTNLYAGGHTSYRGIVPITNNAGDTSIIISPVYDLQSYGYVWLTFSHICKVSASDICQIEYREDFIGSTWKPIPTSSYQGSGIYTNARFSHASYADWQPGDSLATPLNGWWKTEQFNISDEASFARVQFRFKITRGSVLGTYFVYGWLIDNFQINASVNPIAPPVVNLLTTYSDTVYNTGPFLIKAKAATRTFAPLLTPKLYYSATIGGVTTNDSIVMTAIVGDSIWSATIPQHFYGTTLTYAVVASDSVTNTNTANGGFYIQRPLAGGYTGYVIVGNGTVTDYYTPASMYYKYSWARMLYLSNEISSNNMGGLITKLAWSYDNATGTTYGNQTCFFKMVDDTALVTGYVDPIVDGATQVWAGTLNIAQGWVEINLNTPFYLPPNKNLQVYWHHKNGAYLSSTSYWNHTNTSPAYRTVQAQNDGSFPSGNAGSLRYDRPNARFFVISPSNDSNAVALHSIDNPMEGTVGGTQPVKVTIKNKGLDYLDSCIINWSVNNVLQSPVVWRGYLLEDFNDTITLGYYTQRYNMFDTIVVWVGMPNGVVDTTTWDDTLSVVSYGCYGPISGDFIVGTAPGANVPSINDAFFIGSKCGVNGDVTLKLQNATYTENWDFTNLADIMGNYTLTVTSLSGNRDSVILKPASGVGITLNNTDNFIIKDIAIDNTINNDYGIEFTGTSNNIEIRNIHFIGDKTGTSSTASLAPIYKSSGAGLVDDVRFIGNTIEGGYYGIYFYGGTGTSAYGTNVIFDSNMVFDQYYYATYFYYTDFTSVSYNTIYSRTLNAATTWYGLRLYNCDFIANANRIHGKISIATFYGVYFYNSGNTLNPSLFANNEIIGITSSTYYGIYSGSTSFVDIINNSIHMSGSGASRNIYIANDAGANYTIKNNLLVNTSSGYPIYFSGSTTPFTSDYNCLYGNTNVGYISSARTTLAAWQTATGQDANSISVNPTFIDISSNLKLNNYVGFECNRLTNVNHDIEGTFRNVYTSMGCYATPLVRSNAALTEILQLNMLPNIGDSSNLEVLLLNAGLDTIKAATINWTFNGITQPTIHWTGNLASQYVDTVLLGKVIYQGGFNEIVVWLSGIGSMTDSISYDDTLMKYTYACYDSISGNFIVGNQTGADVNSIEKAIYIAQLCGVKGNITLSLQNGVYEENWNFSNMADILGNYTIEINSLSGNKDSVILRPATGNAIVLNNTNNIHFNNITIDAINGLTALNIMGNASNIAITNCKIFASDTATNNTYAGIYKSSSSSLLDRLILKKCLISGGYYGIYIVGTSSGYDQNITIDSNIFSNQFYYGVYLQYVNSNSTSYNRISPRSSDAGANWYGIYLNYNRNGGNIIGNRIYADNSNITTNLYGMRTFYIDSALVANNEIILNSTASTTYGIYIDYPKAVDYVHNSILLTGTSNTARAAFWYVYSNTTYDASMMNNIFITNTSGTTPYAIYLSGTYSSTYAANYRIDYNNYYSSGNLGYVGSAKSDLASWKATVISDVNSINVYPSFVDSTLGLRLNDYTALICPKYPGVDNDIDDNLRLNITSMGCYTPLMQGADAALIEVINWKTSAVYAGDTSHLKVVLFNAGSTALTSATMECKINNVLFATIHWTGSLTTGLSDTVDLDTLIYQSGYNNLIVYITSLGSLMDTTYTNDTIRVSNYTCDSILNGYYTIGASGDFVSMDEAVAVLNLCGINGPVTFAIQPGTYLQNTTIGYINGTSPTNTITFTSITGNRNDVVLQRADDASTGIAPVMITKGENIIIKDLTLSAVSPVTSSYGYAYGIIISDSSKNIEVKNCHIFIPKNFTSVLTSTNYISVYMKDTLYDIRILDNLIEAGAYGIYARGINSGTRICKIIIKNNVVNLIDNYGLYLYYGDSMLIEGNVIKQRTGNFTPGNFYGIYAYYVNADLLSNKIWAVTYNRGIYTTNLNNTAARPALIANNEIIGNITSTSNYGYYIYTYTKANVYHNSFYFGGNVQSRGIYVYSDTSIYVDIKNNNIVMNVDAGSDPYPIYLGSTSYFGTKWTINYNNYYNVNGTNIGYAGGAKTSLSAWKATVTMDANSVSVNPNFLNISTSMMLLDSNGLSCPRLPLVLNDIQDSLRSPLTTMGAYHFEPAHLDVLPLAFTTPSTTVAVGVSKPISVIIVNNGLDTITSVMIGCEVNGMAITPSAWIGSLAPGDSSSIQLGTFIPHSFENSIVVYTYLPNGQTDQFKINDTIRMEAYGCDSMLSGTYTIGATGDFTSIDKAIKTAEHCGISSSVFFEIQNGTYTDHLSINQIPGASDTATLTFVSQSRNASDVIINVSQTALRLNQTAHLNFKDITIYGSVIAVELLGMCENIEFYRCTLATSTTATNSAYRVINYDNTSGSGNYLKDVRFIKNTLSGGYSSMYLYYAGSSSTDMANSLITIDSNIMVDAYYYGIYAYYYAKFKSISYNTITLRSSTTTQYGIYTNYTTIDDGMIGNRVVTNTSSTNYGIRLYYINRYAANGLALIANNEVICNGGSSTIYGLYCYYNTAKIYHNSVLVSGTGSSYALNIGTMSSSADQMYIYNNIFASSSTGTPYGIYVGTAANATQSNGTYLDYNDYYSSGSNLGYVGSAMSSLSALRTATGQDNNSINVNPNFVSASNLNLTSYAGFDCPRMPEVDRDIQNYIRKNTTNMGAYAKEPSNIDAELVEFIGFKEAYAGGGSQALSVIIRNSGFNPIDSATITGKVNNVDIVPVTYKPGSPLLFGDIDTVSLGSFTYVQGMNNVMAAVTLTGDTLQENDTIRDSRYMCNFIMGGDYVIGSSPAADYPTVDSLMADVLRCGINADLTLKFESGTYTGSWNLLDLGYFLGSYTLTVTSLANHSDSVVFANTSGVLVNLNNTHNVIVKHITLNATAGTYAVEFTGNASNIVFDSCKILASPTATTSSYAAIYKATSTGSLNGLTIKHCLIDGGYDGIHIYGTSSDYANGITIDSNIVSNQYYYGIYLYYVNSKSTSYNFVTPRSSNAGTTWYGIWVSYNRNGGNIIGNRIYGDNQGITGSFYGMRHYYIDSALVANNDIYIVSAGSPTYGIYTYNCVQVDYMHNTILLNSTGSIARAMMYTGGSGYYARFMNNILAVDGGTTPYAFYLATTFDTQYHYFDYNTYYSSGNMGYIGSAKATLTDWQMLVTTDVNSTFKLPSFIDVTQNLKLTSFIGYMAPLTSKVSFDKEGKARGVITAKGAYEAELFETDAMMLDFDTTSLLVNISSPATVTLINVGTDTLTSATINWTFNGVAQTPYSWNGNLSSFSSVIINLGNITPHAGMNHIVTWVSNPNNTTDSNTLNDTIYLNAYACTGTFSGVYTVGGVNPDFTTIDEAFTALYTCGISGNVTLSLATGIYPCLQLSGNITGANNNNIVHITSAAGDPDSVVFNGETYIYGTSYLKFSYVTFDAISGGNVVNLSGNTDNIEISHCNIFADPIGTASTTSGIYKSSSSGSSNNIRIIGNQINGGYYGVYLYGSSSDYVQNVILDSNIITNQYYYGVYYYYVNSISTSYNTVTPRSVNQGTTWYGMRLYQNKNGGNIIGNKIHANNAAITSGIYGLYTYYIDSALVANNEIYLNSTASNTYGIYIDYPKGSKFLHNSVLITGPSATARALYWYVYSSDSYDATVMNNLFITNTSGSTPYAVYLAGTYSSAYAYNYRIDYNNYYSTGNMGYVGSAQATLANWKSVVISDIHSTFILPVFAHVNSNLELTDYSAFIVPRINDVPVDINGINRTILTMMGAYSEPLFEGYDLELIDILSPKAIDDVYCFGDYTDVKVILKNVGTENYYFDTNSVNLHLDVSGVYNYQFDTLITVGTLLASKKDTFEITNLLPVSLPGTYHISVYLSSAVDTVYSDDTLHMDYTVSKIQLPYDVDFSYKPTDIILKQVLGTSAWQVDTGTGSNPTIAPVFGTGRLSFSSESGLGSMAQAIINGIDLRGMAKPYIEFWYAHDATSSDNDFMSVKVSTNGGGNFDNLLTVYRYDAAYATPGWAHYVVDLSDYDTNACVSIVFEANSFGGANQNIDRIRIASKPDVAISLITPKETDLVACDLSNQTLKVVVSNLTALPVDFDVDTSVVHLNVTGVALLNFTHNLSGKLAGMESDTIEITNTFDLSNIGTYRLKAYLDAVDSNFVNDTAKVNIRINPDLSIKDIDGVDNVNCKYMGDSIYVSFKILNTGNLMVEEIPVSLQINGTAVISEMAYTQLLPGDSMVYAFTKPYVVPVVSKIQPFYNVRIQTELSCDVNTTNNIEQILACVSIPDTIDLKIQSINKPLETVCDTGLHTVYVSVTLSNAGNKDISSSVVHVEVDSAGTVWASFSETSTAIPAGNTLTHVFTQGYVVPNFNGNYTVRVYIDSIENDRNLTNDTLAVQACAVLDDVSIDEFGNIDWTMDQNIPNPATSITRIPYAIPQDGQISFKVMSINGKILYSKQLQATAGSHSIEIDLNSLSNGIYYYSMEYQGQRIVKKMTVQR